MAGHEYGGISRKALPDVRALTLVRERGMEVIQAAALFEARSSPL